jgi:hypothetical protein
MRLTGLLVAVAGILGAAPVDVREVVERANAEAVRQVPENCNLNLWVAGWFLAVLFVSRSDIRSAHPGSDSDKGKSAECVGNRVPALWGAEREMGEAEKKDVHPYIARYNNNDHP